MNEPSEPVACNTPLSVALAHSLVIARIKRLEARTSAMEAFLETLAADARFFANAQKKALLEGGSVLCHDG